MSRLALPRSVAGVEIPDSALAVRAAELARTACPAFLFNHCVRTYVFAGLAFEQRNVTYDREVAFVAAILHDLGLVEQYMSAEGRFEVDGADAARALAVEGGFGIDRAELVWDAIALHTSLGIVDRKASEIASVNVGAVMDVAGMGLDRLAGDRVSTLVEAFPRLDFKQQFVHLILEMCRKKPRAQLGCFTAEIGRHHVHGFGCPRVDELIAAAPFSE